MTQGTHLDQHLHATTSKTIFFFQASNFVHCHLSLLETWSQELRGWIHRIATECGIGAWALKMTSEANKWISFGDVQNKRTHLKLNLLIVSSNKNYILHGPFFEVLLKRGYFEIKCQTLVHLKSKKRLIRKYCRNMIDVLIRKIILIGCVISNIPTINPYGPRKAPKRAHKDFDLDSC